MRGDGGVPGEGRIVGVPKFHSWGALCHERLLNVQRFRSPVNYIALYYITRVLYFASWSVSLILPKSFIWGVMTSIMYTV